MILRTGTLKDLDTLVRLEKMVFPSDAFNRGQFRRLLTRAHATTLVLESEGRVLGAAVLLWRNKTSTGRLYSIVIAPEAQGKGLGKKLMDACEEEALKQSCTQLSLEVRADNHRAIGLYQKRGYCVIEDLPGYYPDGLSGLRMRKRLEAGASAGLRIDVPYYAQTLEFTCGPACLMMAMGHFNPTLVRDRSLELKLWKEATLIFMTSGLGGCGPFGLAVSARKRGHRTHILLSDRETPFLASVRSQEKKEVIRLMHANLREEALSLGVTETCGDVTFEEISSALLRGEIPIVLVSTYRLHRVKGPHWVVITGFDNQNVYFHDPFEGFYTGEARHVNIPISEFMHMRRYGKNLHKCVVFVGPSKTP
ncbi:MAG: GNAT family N-acetyltransferase/peptidase C39 family protein [bacterium]|nr:GNAT family N-acetyltransferase/peptidase C39 family protein [bacterium]